MQLTSELRIIVVTKYLKTRSFKEVQKLFEQRFRDKVSPTKEIPFENLSKSTSLKDEN